MPPNDQVKPTGQAARTTTDDQRSRRPSLAENPPLGRVGLNHLLGICLLCSMFRPAGESKSTGGPKPPPVAPGVDVYGWTIGHFQMMFLSSVLLRWFALVLIGSVTEANSRGTLCLIAEVVESFSWRDLLPADAAAMAASETDAGVVPSPKHLLSGRFRTATRIAETK